MKTKSPSFTEDHECQLESLVVVVVFQADKLPSLRPLMTCLSDSAKRNFVTFVTFRNTLLATEALCDHLWLSAATLNFRSDPLSRCDLLQLSHCSRWQTEWPLGVFLSLSFEAIGQKRRKWETITLYYVILNHSKLIRLTAIAVWAAFQIGLVHGAIPFCCRSSPIAARVGDPAQ